MITNSLELGSSANSVSDNNSVALNDVMNWSVIINKALACDGHD